MSTPIGTTQELYVPSAHQWQRIDAAAAGFNPDKLEQAVQFAQHSECPWPRSLHLENGQFIGTAYVDDRPPYDKVLGIVRDRNNANGVVLRQGRIVTQWGDADLPDTTFSAAKSYLALVAGIAFDDGLIGSLDETLSSRYLDDAFDTPQNRHITWRHLLQQTSEWQGTLWDRPDSVDHNRQAMGAHDNSGKGVLRQLQPPGTRWEYNDVRVNRLALSLTQLFKRPLGDVLRERIMDPIGASPNWEWHGYSNSVIDIDGAPVASVSGGSHWGGGLFISSLDHARVGLLVQRNGNWNGSQLLSEQWINTLRSPTTVNPLYGALWWLNTNQELYPAAPASSLFAIGGGTNLVWVDNEHDLVVVARWVERKHCNEFMQRVAASIA